MLDTKLDCGLFNHEAENNLTSKQQTFLIFPAESFEENFCGKIIRVLSKQRNTRQANKGKNRFFHRKYLISYFAHKPFKWYSEFSVKTSKILKEHTILQTDTTDAYTRKILENIDGQIFKYDFPAYYPMVKSKRYNGKVYILVNRQTYSMAAVSAALIQDYKFGVIVGEETGDVPTLYASQFSYLLPRTGITSYMKLCASYQVL